MPRVVANQKERFENDELFRKLSRDTEVRYTGCRDRPPAERRICLQNECREGQISIAIVGLGINLQLGLHSNPWSDRLEERIPTTEFVNFDREPNKVHLKSQFILNGVCVIWRGWLDLRRLDGAGRFEFDDERAQVEDADIYNASEPRLSCHAMTDDRRHHLPQQQHHQPPYQYQPHQFGCHDQRSDLPHTTSERLNGFMTSTTLGRGVVSANECSSSTSPGHGVTYYDDASD